MRLTRRQLIKNLTSTNMSQTYVIKDLRLVMTHVSAYLPLDQGNKSGDSILYITNR